MALGLCAAVSAQDDPCPHVFDTGAASAMSLPAEAIERRSAWRLVPERELGHAFKGDAVFLNDRLEVVLRRQGRGAEVYARTPEGHRPRAVLLASGAARLSSVRIVENDLSAVAFDTVFRSGNGTSAAMRLRLTAGQPIVEVTPGQGMGELVVRARSRYTVVPDFFGDDVVFDGNALGERRVGLPAEGLLVHLVNGADAMLMCVWQARNQRAYLVPGVGAAVQCARDKSIWLALMEREHIWTDDGSTWKPPFPAKWRTSAVGDGRAIVYPIDRSRATPLDVFCPTDVMRNTLGCGPCQYLLDGEGLDGAAHPTPADATKWVERQFKRKRARRNAEQIEERLRLMVEHVRHVDARISRYEAFAKQVQSLCAGSQSEAPAMMRSFGLQMAESIASHHANGEPAQRAAQLADRLVGLIGKPNAFRECQALGQQIRTIGAGQDRVLSKCRMSVRRIQVLSRDDDGDSSKRVLKLAEQVLSRREQTK